MPFLPPNQQRQSTDGTPMHIRREKKYGITHNKLQRVQSAASAGFWLGGQCPLAALRRRKFRKFDYEMVQFEVYLNKYVVSIAPFSTPACPGCS